MRLLGIALVRAGSHQHRGLGLLQLEALRNRLRQLRRKLHTSVAYVAAAPPRACPSAERAQRDPVAAAEDGDEEEEGAVIVVGCAIVVVEFAGCAVGREGLDRPGQQAKERQARKVPAHRAL